MKISNETISVLARIITGDSKISSYQTGPELVDFFNSLGFADTYGQGFPSRWFYTEQKLEQINIKETIAYSYFVSI